MLALRSPILRLPLQQSSVYVRGFASTALLRSEGPLPYFVHRTKSKNLPVYYKQKRDGQHQTTIRKLEGDLSVLKTQLAESLDVHPDWIDVKNLKRHVIVRASVKEKVEQFLEQKKF